MTMQGADTQPLPEQAVALMEDAGGAGVPDHAVCGPQYGADEPGLPGGGLLSGAGRGRGQLAAAAGYLGNVRVLLPVSAHSTEECVRQLALSL